MEWGPAPASPAPGSCDPARFGICLTLMVCSFLSKRRAPRSPEAPIFRKRVSTRPLPGVCRKLPPHATSTSTSSTSSTTLLIAPEPDFSTGSSIQLRTQNPECGMLTMLTSYPVDPIHWN